MLADERRLSLLRTAEELIDEAQAQALMDENHALPPLPPRQLRILCAPVNDQADEVMAGILQRLLSAYGHQVSTGSRDLLTSELVQRVSDDQVDVVILSALPPLSNRNGRYLCRQLRQRFSNLPVIYGLWGGVDLDEVSEGLVSCGATRVVAQLRQAIAQAHKVAQELRFAKTLDEPSRTDKRERFGLEAVAPAQWVHRERGRN